MMDTRTRWACRRAAELLEQDARDLRASHTLNGKWVILDALDRKAREEFGELRAVARQLRSIEKNGRKSV